MRGGHEQLMDDSGWNRDGWMRTWIAQRILAPATAMLTPEQVMDAQRAGRNMTDEEALAYALSMTARKAAPLLLLCR